MYVKTYWKSTHQLVQREMGRNLKAGGVAYLAALKAAISTQGHKGYHSPPYNEPFRQTGDLQNSYTMFYDRKAYFWQVGSDLIYSRYLEYGTSKMAPRPHIRPTFFGNISIFIQILCRPF